MALSPERSWIGHDRSWMMKSRSALKAEIEAIRLALSKNTRFVMPKDSSDYIFTQNSSIFDRYAIKTLANT
jgi:hypothetical protein